MRTNTPFRPALAAALLLAPSACITGEVPIGEDEQPLVFDPPDPAADDDPACASFCAQVEPRGCPPTDTCSRVCAAQRADAPACGGLLDAFLACGGAFLEEETCSLPSSWLDETESAPTDPALRSCFAALIDYEGCLFGEPDGPAQQMRERCGTLQFGAGLDSTTGVIESTEVECTPPVFLPTVVLRATCAPGGVCSCLVDDEVAHTCQNLVHDIMLSGPSDGCCSRFFEDLIADLPL